MSFITLSLNFITRFRCYFKINLCWLLLEDNFLVHKKCIFLNMSAKLDLRIRNFVKMQENLWKISCSLLYWLLWIQNYQMTCKYLTSNNTFSKKVNPMKYRIQAYMLWGPGIDYSYILLVYPIRPWNLLNVKKSI